MERYDVHLTRNGELVAFRTLTAESETDAQTLCDDMWRECGLSPFDEQIVVAVRRHDT